MYSFHLHPDLFDVGTSYHWAWAATLCFSPNSYLMGSDQFLAFCVQNMGSLNIRTCELNPSEWSPHFLTLMCSIALKSILNWVSVNILHKVKHFAFLQATT